MTEATGNKSEDLIQTLEENERLNEELAFLFGKETVNQARKIDIVDLNMNKEMMDSISTGVRKLKELKHNPNAQLNLVNELQPGACLVLCMWIMDMGLLEKIQTRPYI